MGADPGGFPAAATRLVHAGFDVIDINFGCPVRKVLGRCRGGFHLGQPEIALDIIRRVRDTVPGAVPVTIKMRAALMILIRVATSSSRFWKGRSIGALPQ